VCTELFKKLGTHYLCPRAVSTAREHGCHFGHSCSRAVDTARGHR